MIARRASSVTHRKARGASISMTAVGGTYARKRSKLLRSHRVPCPPQILGPRGFALVGALGQTQEAAGERHRRKRALNASRFAFPLARPTPATAHSFRAARDP
jgi:hypothetical protein